MGLLLFVADSQPFTATVGDDRKRSARPPK